MFQNETGIFIFMCANSSSPGHRVRASLPSPILTHSSSQLGKSFNPLPIEESCLHMTVTTCLTKISLISTQLSPSSEIYSLSMTTLLSSSKSHLFLTQDAAMTNNFEIFFSVFFFYYLSLFLYVQLPYVPFPRRRGRAITRLRSSVLQARLGPKAGVSAQLSASIVPVFVAFVNT